VSPNASSFNLAARLLAATAFALGGFSLLTLASDFLRFIPVVDRINDLYPTLFELCLLAGLIAPLFGVGALICDKAAFGRVRVSTKFALAVACVALIWPVAFIAAFTVFPHHVAGGT
jgi:ABC-type antimicrobial peptide transport system permease subunit